MDVEINSRVPPSETGAQNKNIPSSSTSSLKPELTGLSHLVARAGEKVRIFGKNIDNFSQDLEVSVGEVRVDLTPSVGGSTPEFVMPQGVSPGQGDVTLVAKSSALRGSVQEGNFGSVSLISDPGDFPIITMVPDGVCLGLKYRNAKGEIRTGTKDCSKQADCSISGQTVSAPASCTVNNAVGCVTTATYKSADWTNLTAENIKNGVTVAGITGTYPSSTNRLAANTAAADLSSFGSTTPVGVYEFFDSAGLVYSATVADGGLVTPGTSDQTLSAAGTMYRSVTVVGDADLTASNVPNGISIFGVLGSLIPTPADCSTNGSQSCVATGTYFAAAACVADSSNCYVPGYVQTTQPLKAISYDAIKTGKDAMRTTLTLADVVGTLATCASDGETACVTTGTYRAAAITSLADKVVSPETVAGIPGNVTLPAAANVLTGTSYGTAGTGLSGALTLPQARHVLVGSGTYGNPASPVTPTLTLPAVEKVLSGVTYGVGGTGSSGTLTLPLASNVISGSPSYGEPDNPRTPSYTNPAPTMIVRPVAPAITGVSFNFTPDRVTLNWATVTGASGYIVLINTSQAVSWAPTDGSAYSTGTYGSDTMIYSGTATTVTYNTAVTAGTTFYFAVYAYETNLVYSYAPTARTMLSCAGLVGGTWIPVPGDSVYGTNGFCVQKYLPSNVGGVPTSQTGASPWVTNQGSARSACSSLGVGYHLISNPEWMTIAANIANTGSNWSGGSVGSGALAQGHSDGNPNSLCAADPNDTKGWVEGDCTGQIQGAMPWSQKRTRILSNNYVIWDIGGNLWQAIDYNNISDKPNPSNFWMHFPSPGTTTTPRSHLVPINSVQPWWSDSWNWSHGIGHFFPGYNGEDGQLYRGGGWNVGYSGPFTATLSRFSISPNGEAATGLRCAWQP